VKPARAIAVTLAALLVLCAVAAPALAAEAATAPEAAKTAAASPADAYKLGIYAIGVTLIMAAGAFGTAMAQKSIGAAVVGAVAEDRKTLGAGLILLALPETILFICAGFAYLLLGKLG